MKPKPSPRETMNGTVRIQLPKPSARLLDDYHRRSGWKKTVILGLAVDEGLPALSAKFLALR